MKMLTPTINSSFPLTTLKRGDPQAYEQMYRNYFHQVAIFVKKNSGQEADAKDIFQEALIIFINKIRLPDFELTAPAGKFLVGIAKLLWLNRIKKIKHLKSIDFLEKKLFTDLELEEIVHQRQIETEKKYTLLFAMFYQLKAGCQQLLKAFYYDNKSMKQISEEMGFTEQYVRVKKYRCMKGLMKKVQQHPDYKNHQNL